MDLVIRPIEPAELRAAGDVFALAFGEDDHSDERRHHLALLSEVDRVVGVFDGSRMVGTAGNLSLEVTLPGQVLAPMAGVTMVAVLPTHRRRGALRSMITALLDQAVAADEPVAGLIASESRIYGRFGFGVASHALEAEIATPHATLRVPDDPGRIRIVDAAEARTLLPAVFDRVRRWRSWQIGRSERWWDLFCDDPAWLRGDQGQLRFLVHHDHEGRCDGYLTYRRTDAWERHLPAGTLRVQDAYAEDPAAYLGLWRVALESDLVGRVTTARLPVDDPVRWALADPRRLRVNSLYDGLWLRLLDLERALPGRRYAAAEQLVLEVIDPHRPGNDGCYRLDAGPDGATCARTDTPPDLGLDIADLGSLFLGGVSAAALAGAGRVHEFTQGALAAADRVFATAPAPFLGTGF